MYEQTYKKNPAEKHVEVKLTLSCGKYMILTSINCCALEECNQKCKILCNSTALSKYLSFMFEYKLF